MLTILGNRHKHRFCDGLTRRGFLRIGGLALGGLTLPQILRAETAAGVRNPHKAVIQIFLPGGPPHQDMFDLKMDAPAEIRGEFKPIKTNVSGIEICELFPRIAAMMDKFAILRDDTGRELGSFKDGYQPHDYQEWLVHNIGTLMDTSTSDLGIGSAGLLKGGAVAWVEVTVPETFTTPEGVTFRPNFLAASSFNGSLATTYKRTVQNTVCDNTLGVALGEKGQQVKIRSTKNSLTRIADAREALHLIHSAQDDFAREVAALAKIKVDDHMFERWMDGVVPLPRPDEAKTTRAITLAENKREAFQNLWLHDERVAPWRGTGLGVLQVANTYAHHGQNVRGMSRQERNMLNAVNGKTEAADAETLEQIYALAS